MPVATYTVVVVDCPDPESLAAFYAQVLGGESSRASDHWYDLRLPDGARIAFQRAEGLKPPNWPRADDNSQQLHLDFDVEDLDAAQEVVLSLGATPLDLDDDNGTRGFRVYADPAGHPFCLCAQ